MRCPWCNYDNDDIAKFCAHCGAKLGETRVEIFGQPGVLGIGVRDKFTGKIIIEPKYYDINGYESGETPKTLINQRFFIACGDYSKKDVTRAVYNVNGDIVIPYGIFTYIWHLPAFSMFVCFAWPSELYEECGFYAYDEQGNRLFKYKFGNIGCPKEGFVTTAMNDDRLYGYIDIRTGKPVFEFKWKDARGFENGYAEVKDPQTKKWGIINTRGEVVIPCEYYELMVYDDGVADYKKHWYSIVTRTTLTDLINKYKLTH